METYLGTIFDIEKNIPIAYETEVRILDKNLGVLVPEIYMPISNKTVQSKQIFEWTYNDCFKIIDRLENRHMNFKYLIIKAPLKVMIDIKLIDTFIAKAKDTERFAFSIEPDTFFDKNKNVYENINKLREKGVKIILANFGCEGFPTSEIINAPVDIVRFDRFLTHCIFGDAKQQLYVKGITEMLNTLKIKILIDEIKKEEEYNKVVDFADLLTGKYFGKFKKDRYIR
ncbi:MAG: EAL domain-containing protein [Clostridia bacterium]